MALLCIKNTRIDAELLSLTELLFVRSIQDNLPRILKVFQHNDRDTVMERF